MPSTSSPFSSSSPLPFDASAYESLSTILTPSECNRFASTEGFTSGWETRRHKHEAVANQASIEARQDWLRLVGHTLEFGACNPPAGNWTALAMPFCLPERVWITGYIVEFAFIHDTVIERQVPDGFEAYQGATGHDITSPPTTEIIDPQLGKKKLWAKITRELLAIDPVRGRDCLAEWQNMIDTTHRQKKTEFASVDEYVEFRVVDCGAPWMASLMAYGMGISLTASEREELRYVTWPFAAAAGLENDYFSFDREHAEFLEGQADQLSSSSGGDNGHPASTPLLINLITLLMRWRDVDVATAKKLTREITIGYEHMYVQRCEVYRAKKLAQSEEVCADVELYLRSLRCVLAGNIVWSSSCPRYHVETRYDPNAGLEQQLTLEKRGVDISVV